MNAMKPPHISIDQSTLHQLVRNGQSARTDWIIDRIARTKKPGKKIYRWEDNDSVVKFGYKDITDLMVTVLNIEDNCKTFSTQWSYDVIDPQDFGLSLQSFDLERTALSLGYKSYRQLISTCISLGIRVVTLLAKQSTKENPVYITSFSFKKRGQYDTSDLRKNFPFS